MPKIFTGLENAFAGPGWAWKPHKSKDQIFYIETMSKKISQLRKKFSFFLDQKNFDFFFRPKIFTKIFPEKSDFFQDFKFQNFDENSGFLEKSPLQFPLVQNSNYWLN